MAKKGTAEKKPTRVLTPDEIELAEALGNALTLKGSAEASLEVARKEIARLTQEINKLDYNRPAKVWAEARERAGQPQAPKVADLVRG